MKQTIKYMFIKLYLKIEILNLYYLIICIQKKISLLYIYTYLPITKITKKKKMSQKPHSKSHEKRGGRGINHIVLNTIFTLKNWSSLKLGFFFLKEKNMR